jgi:hypothetical protein
MSPFLEMPVKRSASHVHIASTNFTRILNTKSMKLKEPKWNRLAIPPHRKLERVVEFIGYLILRFWLLLLFFLLNFFDLY